MLLYIQANCAPSERINKKIRHITVRPSQKRNNPWLT